MSESRDIELSPYERAVVICANCRESDMLYKDAHCIFCHRCGPSVTVTTRDIGKHLSAKDLRKPGDRP